MTWLTVIINLHWCPHQYGITLKDLCWIVNKSWITYFCSIVNMQVNVGGMSFVKMDMPACLWNEFML